MNTKYLITISAFAFISGSVVQAADVIIPQQSEQVFSSVDVPAFSWTGFYFGGQIGGFSSKLSAITRDVDIPLYPDEDSKHKKWVPVEKKYLPKLSGFVGGLYAGANFDLGNSFILGVDTDIILPERKKTKTIIISDEKTEVGSDVFVKNKSPEDSEEKIDDLAKKVIEKSIRDVRNGVLPSVIKNQREAEEDRMTFSHTLKQKWTGSTRVRVGLSAGRMMPYISGGVAYGQFQDILSISITGNESFNATSDATKMMFGYTLGGGVDFAITDNVIVRGEYRYSDFGKKKFKDEIEIKYKTNDFRAGIAYKF
ncbi:opacity protein-like surface antigen [Bartonella callosciuri]|uniref:Porin n=1 Tax=Bartonella callosciuri TaxID=686223 RepID=A0A840NUP5_9HYPH|nr:outer membrane protein [Bartonella callosciuri]MBB5074138.1 opacity protein-like surface antigen [Bartonella callosciuri]